MTTEQAVWRLVEHRSRFSLDTTSAQVALWEEISRRHAQRILRKLHRSRRLFRMPSSIDGGYRYRTIVGRRPR